MSKEQYYKETDIYYNPEISVNFLDFNRYLIGLRSKEKKLLKSLQEKHYIKSIVDNESDKTIMLTFSKKEPVSTKRALRLVCELLDIMRIPKKTIAWVVSITHKSSEKTIKREYYRLYNPKIFGGRDKFILTMKYESMKTYDNEDMCYDSIEFDEKAINALRETFPYSSKTCCENCNKKDTDLCNCSTCLPLREWYKKDKLLRESGCGLSIDAEYLYKLHRAQEKYFESAKEYYEQMQHVYGKVYELWDKELSKR